MHLDHTLTKSIDLCTFTNYLFTNKVILIGLK